MTLTLDVKPETEARLQAAAARRGVAVGVVVDELAATVDAPDAESAEATRRAAIRRARGMLAHLPGTVDEFLQERREEARRELQTEAQANGAAERKEAQA